MAHRYIVPLAAVCLASFSILAGCGSEDGDGATAATDEALIAKSDFIQAANAACEERIKQMQAKIKKVYAKAAKKSRNAGAEDLIEEVVAPGFEGEVNDLSSLDPPPGDEQEVEAVITAIQEMVDRTKSDLAENRKYPYRKTENVAAAYGLPACGHP
jgi:hypothetical protein